MEQGGQIECSRDVKDDESVVFLAELKKCPNPRKKPVKIIAKDGSNKARAQKNKLLFLKKTNPKLFKKLQEAIKLCSMQGLTFECLEIQN